MWDAHVCRRVQRRASVIAMLAITSALLSTPIFAQTKSEHAPVAITLDSLFALMSARDASTIAARALARAADSRIPSTRRLTDPVIQLGFMNYALPQIKQDATLGMTQLQVMQMVPVPGKLHAASESATARASAAHARADNARWSAWSAASATFFTWYQASSDAAAVRESRRQLAEAADIARVVYRSGSGRQSDVIRADLEISRVDAELIRLSATTESTRRQLASSLGISDEKVLETPRLPAFPDSVPTLDSLFALALLHSPELRAARDDVRAAAFDAKLAQRELWPDLQIGIQYGQRRMDNLVDRMGSLMIGASLPVYARDRQRRARDESTAMREMNDAELLRMQRETRAKLIDVRSALNSTRQVRELYLTTILPQADAACTSALSSYRAGGSDFTTVLEVERMLREYRQEARTLDSAEGRAWTTLEALIGQRLLEARAQP